jgi:hypothetical protein
LCLSSLSLLGYWLRNWCRLNWLRYRLRLLIIRIDLSRLWLYGCILIWLHLCLICVFNRLLIWNWCVLHRLNLRSWCTLSRLSLRWVFKSRFFIYFAVWFVRIILLLIGWHLSGWSLRFRLFFCCLNFCMLLNCILRIYGIRIWICFSCWWRVSSSIIRLRSLVSSSSFLTRLCARTSYNFLDLSGMSGNWKKPRTSIGW